MQANKLYTLYNSRQYTNSSFYVAYEYGNYNQKSSVDYSYPGRFLL